MQVYCVQQQIVVFCSQGILAYWRKKVNPPRNCGAGQNILQENKNPAISEN